MGESGVKVVVVMPTFNEALNLERMALSVRASLPDADLLVVDDNSPDGTGELADALAYGLAPHVHVLHRTGKEGLGKAYLAGFDWALSCGYDVIIEMDADGSHQSQYLPQLVAALTRFEDVGLAIGSRWRPGGKVVNWPKSREALSRSANVYIRLMLGLRVRDSTAGYRAYRALTLSRLNLDTVESTGYCFQIDLTVRTARAGIPIVEVPITFLERENGVSKMSGGVMLEALLRVAQWGAALRLRQLRRLAIGPTAAEATRARR